MDNRNEITTRATNECIDLCIRILGPLKLALGISDKDIFDFVVDVIRSFLPDITRYASSDPAKHGSVALAYDTTCCQAVIYYRISNAMLKWAVIEDATIRQGLAFKIYEEAKRVTGIDIHPGAEIGAGFVIDHGVGTEIQGAVRSGSVIGETTIIGQNVTILNGVLLGARDVNNGTTYTERRHPKIGDGVTICGNAQVLGGVTVGDNSFIGSGCIITQDIPSGTKCTLRTTIQMTRIDSKSVPEVDALTIENDHLVLHGNNLENCVIDFVNADHNCCHGYTISVIEQSPTKIVFDALVCFDSISDTNIIKYVRVLDGDKQVIIIDHVLKRYFNEYYKLIEQKEGC